MPSNVWEPVLPPGREYRQENLTELRKASNFIYQIGESPRLRQPSRVVPPDAIVSPVFQAKISYLKRCLRRYTRLTGGKGRGLAGVQVGISERVFVAYLGKEKDRLSVFINPVIEEISERLLVYKEACMSANSLVAPVVRPAWIRFSYYDETGKKHLWEKRDTTMHLRMLNRVLEHEIDHLDGIINIDLVPSITLEFESAPGPKVPKFMAVKQQ